MRVPAPNCPLRTVKTPASCMDAPAICPRIQFSVIDFTFQSPKAARGSTSRQNKRKENSVIECRNITTSCSGLRCAVTNCFTKGVAAVSSLPAVTILYHLTILINANPVAEKAASSEIHWVTPQKHCFIQLAKYIVADRFQFVKPNEGAMAPSRLRPISSTWRVPSLTCAH